MSRSLARIRALALLIAAGAFALQPHPSTGNTAHPPFAAYLPVARYTPNTRWQGRRPADDPADRAYFLAASPTYATDGTLFVQTTTGVYLSQNRAVTWQRLQPSPGDDFTPAGLAISPAFAQDGVMFSAWHNTAGQSAHLYRSTDAGQNWELIWQPDALFAVALSPNFAADQTLLAAGASNFIYRSANAGTVWQLSNTGIEAWYIARQFAFSPNFANDRVVFLAGYGALYRSSDGGATWEALFGAHSPHYGVAVSPAFAHDGVVLAAYREIEGSGLFPESGIFRTTNGGNTWAWSGTGLPGYYEPHPGPLAFRPDFQANGMVYVADRGTAFMGPRQVYRSADSGQTWQALPPPPDAAAHDLLAMEDGWVYLASDAGVWRYRDTCYDLALNGDMERDMAWSFVGGLPATYANEAAHSGLRAIRAGIVAGPPVYSYSDARQWVTLPPSNTLASATLRLWRLSRSTEATSLTALPESTPGAGKLDNGVLPAGALAGDLQYILIVRPDATYGWLLRERANRSTWEMSAHDLSSYAGQTIAVQFGVYNDNAGGITAMYVDDVTLTVCRRE